ncbi:Calx-beta domain-containing protein [Anabaena lutea]|uniref:VCBS repeat-containing protein n=1 Tax=Anabaena lutea FACHB-196 TaxID=2692881 RepID=A0ABR8FIR0_9NOST|nr:FG-GAP-like repeat-containing protein [Anabaena lutea]MBD2569107.1 VCBS repeat-containing protein [Anabaena lutea FACHB-196]
MDEFILQSNQGLSNPFPGLENNGFLDIVSPLQTTRGNTESLRLLRLSTIEAEQQWSNLIPERLSYSNIFGWQSSSNHSVVGQLLTVQQATLSTVTISATDANAAETIAGQGANPGLFTLTRTGNIASSLKVNYTISGTATNGTDYQTLTNSITFAAGLSTAIINVTPSDDTVFEGNETVILNLASSANYTLGTAKTATVNIADNDKPTITISATDASAAETLTGQTANPGKFTLTRTGTTASSLTVNYTVAGTATNGTDYQTLTKIATFAAGSSTAIINLSPIDDAVYEGNETAIVTLASATSYILGTSKTGTVNLVDNDKPTITISATDASAAETLTGQTANPGRLTLTRTGNKTAALTVSYTVAGTATNGTDYNTLTKTVTFAAGSATALIDVNVKDDTAIEGNETVIVTLASGTSYILGTAKAATVNLVDNDSSTNVKPTITISATDANAGETLTGQTANPGKFTLTRTGSTASSLTVNYSVAGTATNGTDYNNLSGTATFSAGASTALINVNSIDDSLVEGNETVIVTLSSNAAYNLGAVKTATVTIADNDKLVSKTDLIHFASSDYLIVWSANGDGTFTVGQHYTPRSGYNMGANNYNFTTGDFNGDGKTDLIHFANSNYLIVWLANSDGTFNVGSHYTPWNGYFVASNKYNFKTGDFNGDGKTDLIHFVNNDYANVWLSKGDGTFDVPSFTPSSGYSIGANNYNFKTGDFNGDGKTDLIHFDNPDSLHLWLANGDGTFTIKPSYAPWNGYWMANNNYNFKTGDFNGDGKTDLIHFINNDYTHVWLSKGDGTFDVPSFTPSSGYSIGANNYNFKTGDFNGDGKTDLIHFDNPDSLHLWLANGDGTFTIKPSYAPWNGYWMANNNYNFKTGDFNGDGKTDLIHFVNNDYAHVWLSKGDGTFDVPSFTPRSGYNMSANDYNFKTGNFNDDGSSSVSHTEDIVKYQPFNDSPDTSKEWAATVYKTSGFPSVNINDHLSGEIGTIKIARRNDGKEGISAYWEYGSPNGDARLPVDNFIVRAHTVSHFEAGQEYKFRFLADDRILLAAYGVWGITTPPQNITPENQWVEAFGYKEVTYKFSTTGWYALYFQMWEQSLHGHVDVSWEKVNTTVYRPNVETVLRDFFSNTNNTNGQNWSQKTITEMWDRVSGESAQFPTNSYASGDIWQVDMPSEVYGVYQDLSNTMFGSVKILTTGYAYDYGYYLDLGAHSALDISANNGTSIKSAVNGIVVDNRPQYYNGSFNGYWVAVDELNTAGQKTGRRWWYGHLATNSLSIGSQVTAGQTVLGTVGQGHVHLGVVSTYTTYSTSMYGNEVRNGSTSAGYTNAVQDVLNRTMNPLQAYWKSRNGIKE